MKWFNSSKMRFVLIEFIVTIVLGVSNANADFVFGEPIDLGERINTPADEILGCISKDGLSLYFSDWIGSNYPVRPGGNGQEDIWVATRVTTDDEWGEPQNLGSPINTESRDLAPDLSADGLVLHFSSDRSGNWDLYVATRATTHDDWGEPKSLETINTSHGEMCPRMTSDGLTLYFTDTFDHRPDGQGNIDLWVSKRATTDDDWSEPTNLGPMVNSSSHDFSPTVSADELTIFFGSTRPGGFGAWDIWVTTRATTEDDWGQPKNLGPPINTSFTDDTPVISFDGTILYFKSRRPDNGDLDLWQALIKPVVDFNSDGIVDAEDMCIIVDNWGTDEPLCDIGPMPWGDGVVDVEDLIVVAEHLFEVYPSAETVEVNEENDGGQIELELGKLLVVTLESNPSTGYRWELIENNESVLKQLGQAEFKSSETEDSPMVGAGGWEIFRFKAVSAGQATLELAYRRPWEDVEPLKTFSIQVIVP